VCVPKLGLLSLVLDTVLDGHVPDVYLVPLAIDYEGEVFFLLLFGCASYLNSLKGSSIHCSSQKILTGRGLSSHSARVGPTTSLQKHRCSSRIWRAGAASFPQKVCETW
jgi:hypothetical protein